MNSDELNPVQTPEWDLVFVGLGSNLGDREHFLQFATEQIRRLSGVFLLRTSSWFETEPVGGPAQGAFLNAVVSFRCSLEPLALLRELQSIETRAQRERKVRWGPRTLDLDLLVWGERVGEWEGPPSLVLPHPRLEERRFVLMPLVELAPDLRLPKKNRTVRELLATCPDISSVIRYRTVRKDRFSGRL